MTRCGYAALLGRPNAGKSTLLNAILGAKISVVSAKPQTTRNRILGVSTEEDVQVIFLDTPGIHKAEGKPRINRAMNRAAWGTLGEADVVCYLVDVERGWHAEDAHYLEGILEKSDKPLLVLVSKADRLKKEEVAEQSDLIGEKVAEIAAKVGAERVGTRLIQPCPRPVSAKRPEEAKELRNFLAGYMPESPWLFGEDDLTDRPQRFLCGEIIREQLFRQLGQELPYSCGVRIDLFEETPAITNIKATIVVQRDSHKGMVIGKGGVRLKEIGIEARKGIERLIEKKVFLEMFVKVQEGWLDSDSFISEFAGLERES
jgi:GTP-binding protein Era